MSALFPSWQVGQGVILKKSHPCGSQRWMIYKLGMDVANASSWRAANSSALWTARHSINGSVAT
jgi:hypothetical protein